MPRSLAQSMPLRWQQVFVGLLTDLHEAYPDVVWPEYVVSAVRAEPLTELDDAQLATHGYVTELGPDGDLEYRDVHDRVVSGSLPVRVEVPDTVPPASAGRCRGDRRPALIPEGPPLTGARQGHLPR